MGSDALAQMSEWLNDEIENRTLFVATLKGGAGDAAQLADKEAVLSLFQQAAAASKSATDLDAFFAAHGGNDRVGSMAKMWANFKSS